MVPLSVLPPPPPNASSSVSTDLAKLRRAAVALEATFLSEMLKSAGFGESRDTFGGGVGEEQFGSILRDAQAKEMSNAGGIGLAEALFEALKVRFEVG